MNDMVKKQRQVIGVDYGPSHLWGMIVRIVKLEDGGFRTQQWDDAEGWIDSELAYGDFFEAIELTPEERRKAGIPEE